MQSFAVMGKSARWVAVAAVTGALAAAGAARAQAGGSLAAKENFLSAAQFGFGGYSVGGLSVQVYSMPIELTIDDIVGTWDLRIGLGYDRGKDFEAIHVVFGFPF